MQKLDPLLVSDIPEGLLEDLLKDRNWGMERKRDGKRCLIYYSAVKGDVGGLEIVSRTGKQMVVPDSIVDAIVDAKGLPDNCLIDGELIWVDENRKDHRTAVQAGSKGRAVLAIWDLVVDRTESYIDRKKRLMKIASKNRWLEPCEIEYQPTYVTEESKKGIMERGAKEGWEGYVFKDLSREYLSGKGEWAYRWKYELTDDYIVIGYTESDKDNPFRALALAAYDKDGNLVRKGQCGGGFPTVTEDEKPTRQQLFDERLKDKKYWQTKGKGVVTPPMPVPDHSLTDKDYGKTYGCIHWLTKKDWFVIEVKSQKLTEYHIPYMPQFIRIREDKLPKQCISQEEF